MSEVKWYSATTDECDAKINELERRIAALEATAKPRDEPSPQTNDSPKSTVDALLQWLEKRGLENWVARVKELRERAEAAKPRDITFNCKVPHPGYEMAAWWRDKCQQQGERSSGLERELGSVKEQLRVAEEIQLTAQSRAETAERERDEWKARWEGMSNRADALAEKLADRNAVIDSLKDRQSDLEKRLAERDCDAERWRWVVKNLRWDGNRAGVATYKFDLRCVSTSSVSSEVDAAIAAEAKAKEAKNGVL